MKMFSVATLTSILQISAIALLAPDLSAADSREYIVHDVQDPRRGLVSMSVPIPKDWSLGDGSNGVVITGPGGVRVFVQHQLAANFDSIDPTIVQAVRQMGGTIAPLVSAEKYLMEIVAPQLAQNGYRLIETYPFPVAGDYWRRMTAGTSMEDFVVEAVGSDWHLSDGTMSNIVISIGVLRSGPFAQWLVFADELQAAASHFDDAKAALQYAAENTRFNPNWQQAHATERARQRAENENYWAAQTQRSQAAHSQRMAALEANAQSASQIANIYSDILDISHQGYLSRSDVVSAGQALTVDTTQGVNVISNPGTGERYRVEAGAKQYWINSDGYYFGIDDTLYDPRTDSRINNTEWTPFRIER